MEKNSSIKHVFYIQNYTTYLVVNALKSTERLNDDNCIFLFGRNFTPEVSFIKSINLTPLTLSYSIAFWRNWQKLYHNRKRIRQIIKEDIKSNYVFYFPFTNHYYVRQLAEHKKCKQINYLEDGVSIFWTNNEIKKYLLLHSFTSFFYFTKIFFNHYFTYYPIPIIAKWRYSHKLGRRYTICKDGFTDFNNRKFLNNLVIDKPPEVFEKMQYLYAPAALVEKSIVKLDTFINSLKQLFLLLNQQGNEATITVHYRFHPVTAMNSLHMEKYKTLFDSFKKISFIEIPKKIALENILYHTNAILITDISSIAIYAHTFNNKVISYNKIIEEYDPNFAKEVEKQPKKLKSLLYSSEITRNN